MLLNDWWGGAGGRRADLPLSQLLQIALTISGCHVFGGSYTPGELFLPTQRIAPMAKDEACLNPACFLLRACNTYICMYNLCIYLIPITGKTGQSFKLPVCQHTVQTGSGTAATGH